MGRLEAQVVLWNKPDGHRLEMFVQANAVNMLDQKCLLLSVSADTFRIQANYLDKRGKKSVMDEEEIDLGESLPKVPLIHAQGEDLRAELRDLSKSLFLAQGEYLPGELDDLSSSFDEDEDEEEGDEDNEDEGLKDEEDRSTLKRIREEVELPLVIDDQPPLKASSPNRLPTLEDYGGDGPIYSENDQYEILSKATQENADIITEELKKVGFISPEFAYIKEWQRRRDPMLTILYGPNTIVEMPGPKPGDGLVKVRVCDALFPDLLLNPRS